MGFKHTAYSFLSQAYENLKSLYPDFNPLQYHTTDKARPGDSVFNDNIRTVEDVFALLEKHLDKGSEWFVSPGKKKEACFTIEMPFVVGKESFSPPLAEEEYTIIRDHGGLMPSGKTETSLKETTKLTLILTLERDSKSGEGLYALASIYPGDLDPDGNWDNLKEGDSVRGEELLKRGIIRVKEISQNL